MKRWLSLTIGATCALFLALWAFSQVPASFLRSNLIIGTSVAQGSGSFVLVEEHAASNSAALSFTTCISGTYDNYQIQLVSLVPASSGDTAVLQYSTNGGSTYDGGAHYNWALTATRAGGSGTGGTNGDTSIEFQSGVLSSNQYSATYQLFSPAGIAQLYGGGQETDGTGFLLLTSAGVYTQSAANAFRVFFKAGNITSGTVRCYGLSH